MEALPLQKVFELLDARNLPGTPKQLAALCRRLAELVELNGEAWVRDRRQALVREWHAAVGEPMKGEP